MRNKDDFGRGRKRRTVVLGTFFCLCLAGLTVRVGYLKFVKGSEYELRAVAQSVTSPFGEERQTNPNRGYILDRNMQPLAVSNRVYTVILDVTILDSIEPNLEDPKKDAKTLTLTALSSALEIPMTELEGYFAKNAAGKLAEPTNYKILARQVPASIATPLKELKCVHLEEDTERKYIDPYFAPQTVGFIRGDAGEASWGLEGSYNTELLGESGRVFRTYNENNDPVTEETPSRDGYTLVTTLDSEIQRIAQSVVEKTAIQIECENVAMMVMAPHTGEVLAMAQWPSFSLEDPGNPQFFTDKRITGAWETLSEEDRVDRLYQMWQNFNTFNDFEPGSIFKPVVVAAALEENIIDPATFSTYCGGDVQVLDTNIPCWTKAYNYSHGGENLREVLANSCNMGMIDIIQRLGKDLFYKYRNDFGFGELTDIDLPGEADVASPYVMIPYETLNPVELATSSMGQGFNSTPIQAITAFSSIINGGNLMKPYVVSQVVDERGSVVKENVPTVVRKVISASTSDYMRETLHAVVSPEGTGKDAVIEGYTIGGKTGSAQQGIDRMEMTLTFMAFTPVEDPEYIVLAVIDRPTDINLMSSESVSPMIRETLTKIIEYKNMLPTEGVEASEGTAQTEDVLSDYSGMELADVTHNLNNLGVDYNVSGSGTVVSYHYPMAGQPIPKSGPIFLTMDPDSYVEEEMTVVPDVETLSMEQGESYIMEAGLQPITFMPETGETGAGMGGPVTYNPLYDDTSDTAGESNAGENAGGDASADTEYYVYKQYPARGVQVQKGTEIKLKVAPVD